MPIIAPVGARILHLVQPLRNFTFASFCAEEREEGKYTAGSPEYAGVANNCGCVGSKMRRARAATCFLVTSGVDAQAGPAPCSVRVDMGAGGPTFSSHLGQKQGEKVRHIWGWAAVAVAGKWLDWLRSRKGQRALCATQTTPPFCLLVSFLSQRIPFACFFCFHFPFFSSRCLEEMPSQLVSHQITVLPLAYTFFCFNLILLYIFLFLFGVRHCSGSATSQSTTPRIQISK